MAFEHENIKKKANSLNIDFDQIKLISGCFNVFVSIYLIKSNILLFSVYLSLSPFRIRSYFNYLCFSLFYFDLYCLFY